MLPVSILLVWAAARLVSDSEKIGFTNVFFITLLSGIVGIVISMLLDVFLIAVGQNFWFFAVCADLLLSLITDIVLIMIFFELGVEQAVAIAIISTIIAFALGIGLGFLLLPLILPQLLP